MKRYLGALVVAAIAGVSFAATTSIGRPDGLADLTDPVDESATGIASTDPSTKFYEGDMGRAFDNVPLSDSKGRFMSKSPTHAAIAYTFNEATRVNAYSIHYAGDSYSTVDRAPRRWCVYGSMDYDAASSTDCSTGTWTLLDAREEETEWQLAEERYFQFENKIAYKSYKIVITVNNGHNQYVTIGELELFNSSGQVLEIATSSIKAGLTDLDTRILNAGESVSLVGFDGEWTGEEGKAKAICRGWTLFSVDGPSLTKVASGEGGVANFKALDSRMRLVWDIDASFMCSVVAGEHGSAEGEGWFKYGETFEPVVTPDDGYGFFKWVSDAKIDPYGESLLVREPVVATARFAPVVTLSEDGEGKIAEVLSGLDGSPVIVRLPPGTYKEYKELTSEPSAIELTGPVHIVGTGDDPSKVVVTRRTSAGNPDQRRIFFINHPDALVRNVTIKDGKFAWGGASGNQGANVYIGADGGTLLDCVISGGISSNDKGNGGNVFMLNGRVSRCVISNGTAQGGYGAQSGGGLYAEGDSLVENCLIRGNKVGYNPNGKNCGSGARLAGNAIMMNCTVVENGATDKAMYSGVFADGLSKVVNCAIFNNIARTDSPVGCSVFGGLVENFRNCASDEVLINSGCYQFADAAFDLESSICELGINSPLRDVGAEYLQSPALNALDLAGKSRISGKSIDIGCNEFQASGLVGDFKVLGSDYGFMPFEVMFEASVEGSGGVLSYQWDFNGDGVVDKTTESPVVQWVYGDYPSAGEYTVNLTVKDGANELFVSHPNLVTAVPKTMYVVPENEGAAYPYHTPETAATDMPTVVSAAFDGQRIIVEKGDYPQTTQWVLSKKVEIAGATGNPGDVILRNTSKIKGDSAYGIAKITADGAMVSGLSFVGAQINNAGSYGAVILTGDSVVSNCVIRDNFAQTSWYAQSPALYMANGLVTHCVMSNNVDKVKSQQDGDCAAVRIAGGTLANSLIIGNEVKDNESGKCRVLTVYDGGHVVNCDIVGNRLSSTNEASAAVSISGETADFRNSVVFGNTRKDEAEGTVPVLITGTMPVRCATDETIGCAAFKNYAAGNFIPASGGPLIDAGETPEGWEKITDLAGNPRVVGRRIDIGCYEGKAAGLLLIVR